MSNIDESKQTNEQGFNRNISFSKRLRREGRSSEAFEIILSALTLEEMLALKLECAARMTNGKLYGLNLWSSMVEVTKEALYNVAISVTKTNKDAARLLGISNNTFNILKKKYNINEKYQDDL
jgi:hypothetical protein